MDKTLLQPEVQAWLEAHAHDDVHKLALGSSPFPGISAAALSLQLAARKNARKKLPTWYKTPGIYFPALLSVEQASSEQTAAYKAGLIRGAAVADLTGGFGVDSYFFSKHAAEVVHCELNPSLLQIAKHNAAVLGANNIYFVNGDGLQILAQDSRKYGTIYIDPVRRGISGKVFLFADCQPNVVAHLDLLRTKASRVIIKSSPLIDLQAGIRELGAVSEIHVVSVKNECRELLWILDEQTPGQPEIVAASLNNTIKTFKLAPGAEMCPAPLATSGMGRFLFEPDAAVMKTGAFNQVATAFDLRKLAPQSHLYTADHIPANFPGRVFDVHEVLDWAAFKRRKDLSGNVVVRNFTMKASDLSKKYNRGAGTTDFLIFTTDHSGHAVVIRATIIHYY